jgi:hypothetical protein
VKTALIPPLGWESFLAQSDGVVMALAIENCMDSSAYSAAVRLVRHSGNARKLVILDNGAAEGQRAKNGTINRFAANIEADEIVLPDVLGSRSETLSKVHEYFRYTKWNPGLRYMGVVQGDSISHAKQCIRDYAELQVRRSPESPQVLQPIKTLGIPRRLLEVTNQMSVRIDLANWILGEFGVRFDIHFLGASSLWAQEVKFAAKYAGHIRSIDTSLPFVFAHYNIDLTTVASRTTHDAVRPAGYMVGSLVNKNPALVQSNIDTYLSWAKG